MQQLCTKYNNKGKYRHKNATFDCGNLAQRLSVHQWAHVSGLHRSSSFTLRLSAATVVATAFRRRPLAFINAHMYMSWCVYVFATRYSCKLTDSMHIWGMLHGALSDGAP